MRDLLHFYCIKEFQFRFNIISITESLLFGFYSVSHYQFGLDKVINVLKLHSWLILGKRNHIDLILVKFKTITKSLKG